MTAPTTSAAFDADASPRYTTNSAESANMEYRALGHTGLKVSALSFGGSSLGGVFHNINEADGIRTVHVALDGGVNFIDTSPYYGITRAETVLGKALKEIARDRYLLATKVGQYGEGQFD